MKLSKEDARSIVYDDHEDWSKVESEIVDTSRWSIMYEGVFLHKPSNKHYSLGWQVGATEQQDERPFEYEDEVEATEVVQVEKIVKVWKAV